LTIIKFHAEIFLDPCGGQTNFCAVDKVSADDFSGQLRSLRLILGKNFRPISTTRLASLSGIALVSIRAVEAGRRRLNEIDRWTISLHLGADWDAESGQWISARDQTPYTREKYESHNSQLMGNPELEPQFRAEYFKMAGQYLDRLEPAKRLFGVSKLYCYLAQILKEEKSSQAARMEKGLSRLLGKNPAAAFDKSLPKQRLLEALKQKKQRPSRP
jgi:hypothetical protein